MNTYEFLEELVSFDPNYQKNYKTLRLAAVAAGLVQEFKIWQVTTSAGALHLRTAQAHDHQADNEVRRAALEADRRMYTRNEAVERRGYVTEGDGV